jgi:hypothetical protein
MDPDPTFSLRERKSVESLNSKNTAPSGVVSTIQIEEFDPGSERTLAAWLRHASQTGYVIYNIVSGERVRNE